MIASNLLSMQRGVAAALTALAVCAALSLPSAATAAKIKVTELTDDFFSGAGGKCSLREAVQAANLDESFGGCTRQGTETADTILLRGGKVYDRTRAGGSENENATGDLDLTGKTTITVKGVGRATIDANDLDRVIEILPGARLTASRLTITDGMVSGSEPGTGGGGISNRGRLDLRRSLLSENEAQRGGVGCGCGGGIENRRRMELRRVSLVQNIATFEGGGIFLANAQPSLVSKSSIDGNTAFQGGGVYAFGSSELRIVQSAVVANDVLGSPTSDNNGGGIFVATNNGVVVSLTNSTVSGNRAAESGGGIFRFSGPLRLNAVTITANTAELEDPARVGHGGGIDGGVFGADAPDFRARNTIVAGNLDLAATKSSPDCFRVGGGFNGRNLLGVDTGCPAGLRDLTAVDPKLKPIADNGGPTSTHALKPTSKAVGKAGASSPKRDQRGVKRDARPDIGAFERR
jgi:CSLREA domain-containing protein